MIFSIKHKITFGLKIHIPINNKHNTYIIVNNILFKSKF